MFTGLIKDIGVVKVIEKKPGSILVGINSKFNVKKNPIGSSISCNGCCLTLVKKEDTLLFFDISNETISCTNVKDWKIGTLVNLEESLRIGDEIGGHLVTGHIDCVAETTKKYSDGDSIRFEFTLDDNFSKFIAKKGSVAIDGVSLTVNNVEKNSFDVNIIPHTLEKTNFHKLKINDIVNIEVDLISRYVERLVSKN